MQILTRQVLSNMANTAQSPPAPASQVYLVAVLLATFSLVIILLILPPLFWHFRNRNIGATSLVAWIATVLLFTFINAILWSSDDADQWFNGKGLCDLEVKVMIASQVALPASLAAVLRALAAVLDTDRATLTKTKAQRRRGYMIDLSCCVGAPLLQMVFHEIVHFRRYYVYGISGCVPIVSDSWLAVLLIFTPPLIWTVVDGFYAVLILVRLYRYRLNFNSILASSNTTKSRFLRLYLICIIWVVVFTPMQIFIVANNAGIARNKFSWAETHSHKAYNDILLIQSHGVVRYDRWLWLAAGFIVFIFFGFGREAINMYRTSMVAIGFGRMFPSLLPQARRLNVSTTSSIGSKAKMLFQRKSSASQATWSSNSSAARTFSSDDEPVSPKTATFLEAIRESPAERDVEKGAPSVQKQPSIVSRLLSYLRGGRVQQRLSSVLPMASFGNQNTTVRSAVSTGQRPGSLAQHVRDTSAEVLVRTEVRQASEHEK